MLSSFVASQVLPCEQVTTLPPRLPHRALVPPSVPAADLPGLGLGAWELGAPDAAGRREVFAEAAAYGLAWASARALWKPRLFLNFSKWSALVALGAAQSRATARYFPRVCFVHRLYL